MNDTPVAEPAPTSSPITSTATLNLALRMCKASPTNPRKHFDEIKLQELTQSIREHGILQPILARPHPDRPPAPGEQATAWEIVAGERRFRAAKLAGLESIPALVLDLSDLEVLEIQVIENLQRSDLHPLEEADGYGQLIDRHGLTPDEVALKIGKSKSYVYRALKLRSLCNAARKAFFEGKLTASTALVVARIANPELQAKATSEIANPRHTTEPLSRNEAVAHVRRHYMHLLSAAPFKISDESLIPAAGPCTSCNKRSSHQRELLSDGPVERDDLCLDSKCWSEKELASVQRKIDKAKDDGIKVVQGAAAKKIKPSEHSTDVVTGYVNVDALDYRLDPAKTPRKALGKLLPNVTMVLDPRSNGVIEVITREQYLQALKEVGIKAPAANQKATASELAARRKLVIEGRYRQELHAAVSQKAIPQYQHLHNQLGNVFDVQDATLKAGEEALRTMLWLACWTFYRALDNDSRKRLLKLWGQDSEPRDLEQSLFYPMQINELLDTLLDLVLVQERYVGPYSPSEPVRMLTLAKIYNLNTEAIMDDVRSEVKKAQAAKAAGKKAATKKTAVTKKTVGAAKPSKPKDAVKPRPKKPAAASPEASAGSLQP
jgi:ParB/RepB/Spo0J family partition protein